MKDHATVGQGRGAKQQAMRKLASAGSEKSMFLIPLVSTGVRGGTFVVKL